jgi:hypothetical protein
VRGVNKTGKIKKKQKQKQNKSKKEKNIKRQTRICLMYGK